MVRKKPLNNIETQQEMHLPFQFSSKFTKFQIVNNQLLCSNLSTIIFTVHRNLIASQQYRNL